MGSNVGLALETLGRGLFAFAGQRLDREAREIEAMRQDAIAKLNRDHDVSMAQRREKHDIDLFDKREDAEEDRFKRQTKAEEDRDRRNFANQERLLDKRSVADALEQANRDYTSRLVSLQNTRKELMTEKAKLSAQGFSDPEGMKAFDQLLDEVEAQEQVAKQSHILTTRRIQSGGYGKTDTVSAEEVARLIGEKEANTDTVTTDPVREAGIEAATGAVSRSRAARESGATGGAAAPAATAPTEPELFPGAPPGGPMGTTELVLQNQAVVNRTGKPPSISDVLERARQVLSESSARNKKEAEDRQRRENFWRDQAIPVQ